MSCLLCVCVCVCGGGGGLTEQIKKDKREDKDYRHTNDKTRTGEESEEERGKLR